MKIFIKILILPLFLLTACTDKKAQNSSDNALSPEEVKEIQQIEILTDEMDKTKNSIEETARELDAVLDEIDN